MYGLKWIVDNLNFPRSIFGTVAVVVIYVAIKVIFLSLSAARTVLAHYNFTKETLPKPSCLPLALHWSVLR
jgi:hypothetical protein